MYSFLLFFDFVIVRLRMFSGQLPCFYFTWKSLFRKDEIGEIYLTMDRNIQKVVYLA